MPDGMIGYGTRVRIGRGATPNWTPLELLGDVEMPDEEIDEVEVTHQLSPGRRRQFIAGLIDSGELTVPMNLIPGSDTDVMCKQLKASGEEVIIGITLSEGGTEEERFTGFLKGYGRAAPIDDKMTAEATFRLSSFLVPGAAPASGA
jgi:hypothetical protein